MFFKDLALIRYCESNAVEVTNKDLPIEEMFGENEPLVQKDPNTTVKVTNEMELQIVFGLMKSQGTK